MIDLYLIFPVLRCALARNEGASGLYAVIAGYASKVFPVEVRYSSISASYLLEGVIFASFTRDRRIRSEVKGRRMLADTSFGRR